MFSRWQDFVSQPDLSRKFASQFIVHQFGLVVSGTFTRQLNFSLKNSDLLALGTYFGPRSEFDALEFDKKVASDASSSSVTADDWLGSVANWATQEAINLVGDIVSLGIHPNPMQCTWGLTTPLVDSLRRSTQRIWY